MGINPISIYLFLNRWTDIESWRQSPGNSYFTHNMMWIRQWKSDLNLKILSWLVVWLPSILFLQINWEFHHPNWRTHIFSEGWPNHQAVSQFGKSRDFDGPDMWMPKGPEQKENCGHWWRTRWTGMNCWDGQVGCSMISQSIDVPNSHWLVDENDEGCVNKPQNHNR